jgi:hypothetical protein
MPITLGELNATIASHKSTASGLDNISSMMLKHLPTNAYLLNILNKILLFNKIPNLWKEFKVIPIPKANSTNSFRPIALSSLTFAVHLIQSIYQLSYLTSIHFNYPLY